MRLETERLILREYTMDDFDALYEILSDPETMKHYPKPYDEAGTNRWLTWSLNNYKEYGFGPFQHNGDSGFSQYIIWQLDEPEKELK